MADVSFTTAPEREELYEVGDAVEVYCDHVINDKRLRGWLGGVVVQADVKMVAIQFQEDVYLTDGWMIPDHVLWCPQNSNKIRYAKRQKRRSK